MKCIDSVIMPKTKGSKQMNTNDNLDNKNLPVGEEPVEKKEITSTSSDEGLANESTLPNEPTENEPAEKTSEHEPDKSEVQNAQEETDENPSIDYNLNLDSNESDDLEDNEDADDELDENSVSDMTSSTLLSIEEVVQKLRDLLELEMPQRKDVDEYKNQFYHLLRNETEKQKTIFEETGGEDIDFVVNEPPIFSQGKELLQQIKEKRAQIIAQQEVIKEANVAKKIAITERIKELTENSGQEDFNKTYQEFRGLQQQWSEIKLIPQAKVNELWKSYQHYVEKFYDLVRINNEFREYDFKKNFELKTALCESAEKLNEEPDVISAFHQLQNLHQEWREIGPVSRKDREEVWNRFKDASAVINKKYQSHFEGLKEQENENLAKKSALCEQLEAIDYSQLKTLKDWNAKLKEVLNLQDEWRKIGYVPRKLNTKIYNRYRAACDVFFKHKNDFYKSMREEMEENLQKKNALCERAEALKDSQDWKKTTKELMEMQREWKKIGIIPRKYMNSTWKRFIAACDYFFEQKKLHTSSHHNEEAKNLTDKREIIEKIKAIDTSLSTDDALQLLRELMDEWYQIGYVPYKFKDKVYSEFYEATEAQYDRLEVDKSDRKLDNFMTNLSDMTKSDNAKGQILREREKLMRQYERMKSELQTYENNIGFLSVSSKKGNSLLDDMNQKVNKIKLELDLIVKKIDAIDKEL